MPESVLRWVDLKLEWLKARERKVLLVTVVAQLLILLGMISLRAVPLVTGQTVLVRVLPVDPRDLLRRDAERGQGGDVRPLVPRVAHDADPAHRPGQRIAQHLAELGPVVVGDDDVGVGVG